MAQAQEVRLKYVELNEAFYQACQGGAMLPTIVLSEASKALIATKGKEVERRIQTSPDMNRLSPRQKKYVL